MTADNRPRFTYVLGDGSRVQVIHDHDETPKQWITYQRDGRVEWARLLAPAAGRSVSP